MVLTHRNILGNCAQIDASGLLPVGEKIIANLPIFHSFGFTVTLWYPLLACAMMRSAGLVLLCALRASNAQTVLRQPIYCPATGENVNTAKMVLEGIATVPQPGAWRSGGARMHFAA